MTKSSSPRIYNLLNIRILKRSYTAKFLFVAFIGIHLPLIGMGIYLLYSGSELSVEPGTMMLLLLLYTLVATGLTLWVLNGLLYPVKLARKALDQFREDQTILPIPDMQDEVGQLLRHIHETLGEIKELSTEKQAFIQMVSHDLRSPINSIIGLSRISLATTNLDETHQYADLIGRSAEKANLLIQDIPSILKFEHYGIRQEDKGPVHVKKFVEEHIDLFRGLHAHKNITFKIDLDDEDTITAHPVMLDQVIQNLVSNALKYSNPHGEVKISGSRVKGQYVLKIRDNGIGFPPEKAPLLFEMFTSESRKGTSDEPSTGLGLYLTRLLVEKHRGYISASSQGEGKGAEFVVQLPLAS